ncbi:MAG: putative secreted protein [Candidatus Phytoplasma asteris]|nr:MAG: putative secreted protein, AYWB SAP11-like protein [Periwinkle leaf yellowing phytoplasma]WEX19398.1 MAG: putative secreted protein [Candidatus Phytoplasma asteris]
MFKFQHNLLFLNILLFIVLEMFLITNYFHQVMAAPKKHGKDIISSKEEVKDNVKKYYELYNTLENYSEKERNKIIQMLSDPAIIKTLEEKIKETKTHEKGSSYKKPDNLKK